LFWDLADQTPEGLLQASGAFVRLLAMVRAHFADGETYETVHAMVLQRLEPLSDSDKMRWNELMWFILSWDWYRRPREEWEKLSAAAVTSQKNVVRQHEVITMSQTMAQEVMAKGEARGVRAVRDILRGLIEDRFGELPATLAQRIETIEDLERLKICTRQVSRVQTLDELQL
jgi:hypothetical protein